MEILLYLGCFLFSPHTTHGFLLLSWSFENTQSTWDFMFCKGSKLLESMEDLSVNYKTNKREGLVQGHLVSQGQKRVLKPTLSDVYSFHCISLSHYECKLHENRDGFPLPIVATVPSIVPGIEEVLNKYLLNRYINRYYGQIGIVFHRLFWLGLLESQTIILVAH